MVRNACSAINEALWIGHLKFVVTEYSLNCRYNRDDVVMGGRSSSRVIVGSDVTFYGEV